MICSPSTGCCLDLAPLGLGQRARLREDALVDAQLADVVEERALGDRLPNVGRDGKLVGDQQGALGDRDRMLVRIADRAGALRHQVPAFPDREAVHLRARVPNRRCHASPFRGMAISSSISRLRLDSDHCGAERGVGRERVRPAGRRGSSRPPSGPPGVSVAIAALLLVALGRGRVLGRRIGRCSTAHTRTASTTCATPCAAAHDLIRVREQVASRRAARLAARSGGPVRVRPAKRGARSRRSRAGDPDVGFILWNGRTIGRSAIDLPHAAITVYSGARNAGQVIVAARPDMPLLEAARKQAPATGVFYHGCRPPRGRLAVAERTCRSADVLEHDLSDSEILSKNAHAATVLYAYRAQVGDPAAVVVAGPDRPARRGGRASG